MHFLKESIGIVIIVVFIIFMEIITNKITQESLDNINTKIEFVLADDENIKEKVNDLSNAWYEEESKLSCYMEHDELEEISKSINSLVFYSENNDKEHIKEQISKIRFKMEHIEDKQKIKLENIF